MRKPRRNLQGRREDCCFSRFALRENVAHGCTSPSRCVSIFIPSTPSLGSVASDTRSMSYTADLKGTDHASLFSCRSCREQHNITIECLPTIILHSLLLISSHLNTVHQHSYSEQRYVRRYSDQFPFFSLTICHELNACRRVNLKDTPAQSAPILARSHHPSTSRRKTRIGFRGISKWCDTTSPLI